MSRLGKLTVRQLSAVGAAVAIGFGAIAIGFGSGSTAGSADVAYRLSADSRSTDEDAASEADGSNAPSIEPGSKLHLDRSGKIRRGSASFYSNRYAGKTMADGTLMRLYSSNAASLTLPLGTVARVTNLATGRSAVVTIQDRGPYIKGRIVDLSPATARTIGITQRVGVARVEVQPLSVPAADGTIYLASLGRRNP